MKEETREGQRLNGVVLEELEEGLKEIAEQEGGRHSRKRSRVQWLGGFKFNTFVRNNTFVVEEPTGPSGREESPNAMEYVLGALGACLATGFVLNATQRGVTIQNLEIALDSSQDNVFTFFGLSDEGHPGFQDIKAKLYVQADASEDVLKEIWERAVSTSPVGNSLGRTVAITPELSVV